MDVKKWRQIQIQNIVAIFYLFKQLRTILLVVVAIT